MSIWRRTRRRSSSAGRRRTSGRSPFRFRGASPPAAPARDDCDSRSGQAVRPLHGGRSRQPRRQARRNPWIPRPERRGKDDDASHDRGVAQADVRADRRQRPRRRDRSRARQGVARFHPRSAVHLREADGRRVSSLSRRTVRARRQRPSGARARDARALRAGALGRRARRELLARHEAARRDVRGVSAPAAGGGRGRADGRPRSARRAADQRRVPQDERARGRDSDEHAHARGRAGDVRPHQHHPQGPHHRDRHRGGDPRARRSPRRSPDVGVPQADRRQRTAGDRRDRLMVRTFPYLLVPHVLSSRNRARRREKGDLSRALLFGGVAVAVCGVLYQGAFWLTGHLEDYAELGDYLLRMGLSWLFLTFLSFLAFSGVVTALSTFFLSDDLRLLLVAPVATRRLFLARFLRTVVQSSWMVVIFLVPVLVGVGRARCAGISFYATALLTIVPFSIIPVAAGTAATLVLVNTFPARRARDLLMLMGLLFAASLVMLLRFIRPEQLLRVESLPDLTDFFATLQSPITPLLPSFWAGETIFASLTGGHDLVHASALWTSALAALVR